MTPQDFRAELERLSLTQGEAARFLDVTDRTLRRWAADGQIPQAVALLLPRITKSEIETWRNQRS